MAIAWLQKEDWPRWQLIDPDLPAYDHWLAKIEAAIKSAEQRSTEYEKLIIDPDQFVAWCKAKGRTIDRSSRAGYAAALLLKKSDLH